MVSPTDMWSRSADLSDAPKHASTCTCFIPHSVLSSSKFMLHISVQNKVILFHIGF